MISSRLICFIIYFQEVEKLVRGSRREELELPIV